MAQLHFRLIIVPQVDTEPDLLPLKRYVESCDLVIHSIRRIKLDQADDSVAPEVSEWCLDVHAGARTYMPSRKQVFLYQELRKNWLTVTSRVTAGCRPILQLCDNACFLRTRKACHQNIRILSLTVGVHARPGEFVLYHKFQSMCMMDFQHDCKDFVIFDDIHLREIFVPYKHIRNLIVNERSGVTELYIDLLHPPAFNESKFINLLLQQRPKTYRTLPFDADASVVGKSNVICIRLENTHLFEEILSCLRYRCDKIPVHFVHMDVIVKCPPTVPDIRMSHFGCLYMWTALIHRSFTILEQSRNIAKDLEKLTCMCCANSSCLEKALTTVLFAMDSGKMVNYWIAIESLYKKYVSLRSAGNGCGDFIVPSNCRLIRRVTLTPTRILLWPADLMCENRILRNFNSEYFLRVTFRDEDMINLNFRLNDPIIFQKAVNQHLNSGLLIGGRKYELLAWSSSQLREHGVSMYAKDSNGYTASYIRTWTEMNPSTNMNIPKCLSRIGQCFSQTEETVSIPIDDSRVRFENDIEKYYNPATGSLYCFSDGIGKISVDLAKRVGETLRHCKESSAFQIRYGGCKGMLVIDPTMKDADIVIRNSMRKFDCRGSGHTKLEIAKKSAPISLRLNRPLIAILNDLGIAHATFLRMQENMLRNLTDMLIDEESAAHYLNARMPFSVFKFKEMSQSGIGLTTEPFLRTLLLSLHRYYIDAIKSKANIEIDPSEGRNMFGVLDETAKLESGQVFVQYSRDISVGKTTPQDTVILKGTVMVTKCPCVHPADVRKFQAVDIPELHHIIDCIVFPQKGMRPHPDEIAGSDLDGDEYAVIWKRSLIFEGDNHEAPGYPKPATWKFKNVYEFLHRSKTEDVVEFLVEYIKNDQIGSIASAHLAYADDKGVTSPLCIRIAAKHALAVDFAKTGYTERLDPREVPRKYPDFMEKFWKRRYRSKKSLGKMYRVSKDFESENEAAALRYQDVQVDPALVVEGWQEFESSAVECKHKYNSMLRTLLQTYGISHETEAFGGSFLKLHSRFRERRDRAEIVNVIHTWLKELVKKTKQEFCEEFGDSENLKTMTLRVSQKASAWYVVTYREENPEFLSFPWIVSEYLSNIRILKPDRIRANPIFYVPIITKIQKVIESNTAADLLPPLRNEAYAFLNALTFHCNRNVVETAIKVLTKWADEEHIISFHHVPGRKFLFYRTFVKLILHVAEEEGYVSSTRSNTRLERVRDNPSSAALCIAFFRFCVRFRFCNKEQVREIIPFDVFNDRTLSKRAMVMFHSIAVTGMFPTLCNQEYMDPDFGKVDMKPVQIPATVLGVSPIQESSLRQAEGILMKHSEVEFVSMRERCQTRCIIVSGYGTVFTLRRLESILRKEEDFLKHLFRTGEMPERDLQL